MDIQELDKLIKELDQESYLNNLSKMKDSILDTFPSNALTQQDALQLFSVIKESGLVASTLDKNFGTADKMWRSLLKEYKIPNYKLWS